MYTEMKINKLFILAALSLSLVSCSDLFEPAQENNRSLDEIYEEPTYAQGLLGYAYAMLPYNTKSVTDVATDDAVSNDLSNSYLKMATGSWAANNDPMNKWTSCRASIQYLNIFLQEVDKVDWAKDKGAQQMFCESRKGEAYALRALNMYYLLMNHGGWTEDGQLLGVPNLTKPEDTSSDFNQPRATFQACLDQIYSDLDQAEQLLPLDYNDLTKSDPVPEKYTAMGVDNYQDYNRVLGSLMRGRVSGRIAKAIRAQVSLLAASPAFNKGTNVDYKRAADDAASLLDLIGGVSGLSETGNSWYAQTNEINNLQSGECPKEIIWRGNKTNGADDWDLGLNQEADNFPPSLYGKGRINPTQNLVDAFPAANGYPITDERSGYDDLDPYSNRDPRLDLYIIYNGCKYKGATINTDITTANNDNGLNKIGNSTRTGYYMKKLLREDCNPNPNAKNAQYHYPVYIRYTEIFLDYAEAANEAWGPKGNGTHAYSAYDVIKAIRHRAGITDDSYLDECANDLNKMRELIRNERRIELCFENKRFNDLRRWKAPINEAVHGVEISTEAGIPQFKDITVEERKYDDYMYYGPVPQTEILKWDQLKQNAGWKITND